MIKINEDLRRWFKEKWTAQDGSKCGEYKGRGRVKCRPSKRVSSKSPQTWSEMSPEQKKKAVRLKQKAHREGKQFSSHKSGKTWDGPKNKYKPGKKKVNEMYEKIKQLFLERKAKKKDCGCDQISEEKKPYKGFKKGKNHPEGGLSRAEARRQGIHAGIETKDEAKRKGGFNKLSKKTQKRRKSFCARMCGMKKRRTSSKTARDPKSKINAALRVWGCRCGANESYETESLIINEGNKPTNPELWSRAKALAKKKFDVYPSAYANGWAAKWYKGKGGGWKSGKETNESIVNERKMTAAERVKEKYLHKKMASSKGSFEKQYPGRGKDVFYATTKKMAMSEEIVNMKHAGSMTDAEIAKRDNLVKKLKNVKPIKGNDSVKNAKYRYATFLVLKSRKKEKGETSGKGKKKKK